PIIRPTASFVLTGGAITIIDGSSASITTADLSVPVNVSGINSSDVGGGTIMQWHWSIDGLALGTTTAITSANLGLGVHTVTLTVTDDVGFTSPTVAAQVTVAAETVFIVAVDDTSYSVEQGGVLSVPSPGVLVNDTIPPGANTTVEFLP